MAVYFAVANSVGLRLILLVGSSSGAIIFILSVELRLIIVG